MSCPSVTIVIPTYSRPAHLLACLETICALEYQSSKLEVIVVDDGSPQDLKPIFEKFRTKLNLTHVRQSNNGPAAARNVGVACAGGDILAFTDDDCRPDKNWLQELVKALDSHPGRLVGGRTTNLLSDNCYSQASQSVTEFLYDYYATQHTEMRFFTTNNLACFRDAFKDSNGFCTKFFSNASEDRDFCNRWTIAGKELFFAPNAVVGHSHEMNLQSFWKQHLNYGCGAYTFHKLRASRNQSSIKIEPVQFYASLIASPLSKGIDNSLAVASLVVVSQFANAFGFFTQLGRHRLQTEEQRSAPGVIDYEIDGAEHSLALPLIAH